MFLGSRESYTSMKSVSPNYWERVETKTVPDREFAVEVREKME